MAHPHLVGGWATPLKNMSSSVGMSIPNLWTNNFMFQSTNQTLLGNIDGLVCTSLISYLIIFSIVLCAKMGIAVLRSVASDSTPHVLSTCVAYLWYHWNINYPVNMSIYSKIFWLKCPFGQLSTQQNRWMFELFQLLCKNSTGSRTENCWEHLGADWELMVKWPRWCQERYPKMNDEKKIIPQSHFHIPKFFWSPIHE